MIRLVVFTSLLAFLSTSLLVMQWGRNETLELENSGLKGLVSRKIEVKKLQSGAEMAKVPVIEVSRSTLNEVLKPQIDSLRQLFHADLRRIEQFQKLEISTRNAKKVKGKEVKVPIPVREDTNRGGRKDSTVMLVFHYQDKWMDRNDTLAGDSLKTNVDFKNDLKIIVRRDKRVKWWQVWKKRQLVGEVYSGNPDTEIKDFQVLKLIDK